MQIKRRADVQTQLQASPPAVRGVTADLQVPVRRLCRGRSHVWPEASSVPAFLWRLPSSPPGSVGSVLPPDDIPAFIALSSPRALTAFASLDKQMLAGWFDRGPAAAEHLRCLCCDLRV